MSSSPVSTRSFPFGLSAVLALFAACSFQMESGREDEALASGARTREAPRVRVAPIVRREMVQVLETTNVLESVAEIELLPRMSGRVVEVLAEEGDHVPMEAVLARIDNRDAELEVRDAEVALVEAEIRAETAALAVLESRAIQDNMKLAAEQAQRDYERNQRLFEGRENASALSAQALETSRLDLEKARHDVVASELAWKKSRVQERDAANAVSRAEVALERAKLTHEYTEIRAPFAGVIASRSTRVGDTVGSEPMFVLTDTENLRAVLHRPQRELGLFAKGIGSNGDGGAHTLTVTARAEALPGLVFRGRIERTSPTVDANSGSFRVTARLDIRSEDGSGPRLLPGMLVRLEIVTDRHAGALVVPKRSIRREADQSFVMVVDGEVARRVDVEEGFSDDDFVEIVPLEEGALEEGQRIVTVGARDLADGAAVSVDDESPPDAEDSPPAVEPDADESESAPEEE